MAVRNVSILRLALIISLCWSAVTLFMFLRFDSMVDLGHKGHRDLELFDDTFSAELTGRRFSDILSLLNSTDSDQDGDKLLIGFIDHEISKIYEKYKNLLHQQKTKIARKSKLYGEFSDIERRMSALLEGRQRMLSAGVVPKRDGVVPDILEVKADQKRVVGDRKQNADDKQTYENEQQQIQWKRNIKIEDKIADDDKHANRNDPQQRNWEIENNEADDKIADNIKANTIADDIKEDNVPVMDHQVDGPAESRKENIAVNKEDVHNKWNVEVPIVGKNVVEKGDNLFDDPDGTEANIWKWKNDDDVTFPPAVYDIVNDHAPGEMGRPFSVNVDSLSPEESDRYKEGQRLNAYNQYVSDMISVRRRIPEPNIHGCRRSFRPDLSQTSIIICFHNEAWSALLRTVHSVIDRSPAHLLGEIILVDDCSTMDHLHKPLEKYMARLGKVRILRMRIRQGLIRARLTGVAASKFPLLTFLDSHIECYPGWLEPLLDRVAFNSTIIATPTIVGISSSNFATGSQNPSSVGTFKLTQPSFNWMSIQNMEKARRKTDDEPVRTPVIAGGLFTVSKDYFLRMGAYDPGMDIWGAENIEISLRVWMCGGSLEILPCSQVGHIFRSKSPYSWGRSVNDILKRNTVRLVEVWFDEYKQFYYETLGYNLGEYGDVSERKKLRERLQCKSFEWYLKNILPEMYIPPKAVFVGEIRGKPPAGHQVCLDSMMSDRLPGDTASWPCHGQQGNQLWKLSDRSTLMQRDQCLYYKDNPQNSVKVKACTDTESEKWERLVTTGQIQHVISRLCLEWNTQNDKVKLSPCSPESAIQIWMWVPIYTVPQLQ